MKLDQCLIPLPCVTAALEDSQSALSAHVPALSSRIVQDLSESCFGYLKSALEVPRLYRRTNKVSVTRGEALWCAGPGRCGSQSDLRVN